MALGNIYNNKNYKLMAIVPIAMLLISIYFIPHIPLDSTLRGGINVQIQTNSSINSQALTSAVDSKIQGAQASVSTSPGGITVGIAANQSVAAAQQELADLYTLDANYSTYAAQVAIYQNELKTGTNSTVQTALASAEANETTILGEMSTHLNSMRTVLQPLLNGKSYPANTTDSAAMLNAGSAAYSNATATYKAYVISSLKSVIPFTSYTYQEVTPTLGAFFLQEMQGVIITSFILVAIAVLFIFRTPVPALSVVFGAGNDIIVALGAMGLFGIPLGVASIGGLLMLIGYSIDTDMLSAIRIIKRTEGTPADRAYSTMGTGITMTTAAIISFAILLTVSYYTFIPTYFEIASVVLFGLIADIFTTWFGNTPMVLWYKQRKEARSI